MPKNFIQYFTELEEKIKEAVIEAELVSILQLEADFKRRIFNEGISTNGTPIGKYNKDFAVSLFSYVEVITNVWKRVICEVSIVKFKDVTKD